MSNNDLVQKIGDIVQSKVNVALEPVNEKLDVLTERVGVLTVEMIDVKQTTRATYDLVKMTYESNKREINEVKVKLDMTAEPSVIDAL